MRLVLGGPDNDLPPETDHLDAVWTNLSRRRDLLNLGTGWFSRVYLTPVGSVGPTSLDAET